ncbi:unnamed protein product, partial [Sphenostylis stenocarpa]
FNNVYECMIIERKFYITETIIFPRGYEHLSKEDFSGETTLSYEALALFIPRNIFLVGPLH